jgi:patatin-like phospholipase/acyl hydrolase
MFARDKGERHLVDGGVYANNPSMCSYVEAAKIWPGISPESMFMLSVGTGKVVKPYHHCKTRHFGYIHWLNPILDILMSSVAETTDYQMKQLFNISGVPEHYVRIEPPVLTADSRIDNASPSNIRRLSSAAQSFIDHNSILLDNLATSLIKN